VFFAALFVVGVGFGAAAVRALGPTHQAELVEYLEVYLRGLSTGGQEVAPSDLWRQAVTNNIRTVALLWASGPVVVGLLLAPAIIFVRGFVIGFATGFLSYEFGLRGVLLALLGVLPQNLLAVPALLVVGSVTASFSAFVLRRRPERRSSFASELAAYTVVVLAMMLVLVLSCTVEAYVAPVLMRLVVGVGGK
jgi:stage II sporulation protein M